MVKAILFDLGNTLVIYDKGTLEDLYLEGLEKVYSSLKSWGKELPSFKKFKKKVTRHLVLAYWKKKFSKKEMGLIKKLTRIFSKMGFSLTDEQYEELGEIWFKPISRDAVLPDDAIGTLDYIKSTGLKMGIISNTVCPGFLLEKDLVDFGIDKYFDFKLFSADEGVKKPHKSIFKIALAKLKTHPEQVVFIGDTPKEDIKGASKVGMKTVFINHFGKRRKFRKYKPDYEIQSLRELRPIIANLLG